MALFICVVVFILPAVFSATCGPPNFKITTLTSAPYWWTVVDDSYCIVANSFNGIGDIINNSTTKNCAIIFSICKPLPALCPNQEVCKIKGMDSTFKYISWPIGLGSTDYSGFKFGVDKNSFKIEYHNGAKLTCKATKKLQPIKTEIIFNCDKKAKWNATIAKVPPFPGAAKAMNASIMFDVPNCMYRITFNSDEGCPDYGPGGSAGSPLSTGSILLIIFFPSIFLYCIIGILVNTGRNKSGAELIPNYKFWKEFPSLVVDGCAFMIACITCHTVGDSRPAGQGAYQTM